MEVKAVKNWYSEAQIYCSNNFYNNPPNSIFSASQAYGHFTYLVWKSSTKVGRMANENYLNIILYAFHRSEFGPTTANVAMTGWWP